MQITEEIMNVFELDQGFALDDDDSDDDEDFDDE